MFKLKASIEKLEPYEKVVTTKNLTYCGSRHSEYRKAFDVKQVFLHQIYIITECPRSLSHYI